MCSFVFHSLSLPVYIHIYIHVRRFVQMYILSELAYMHGYIYTYVCTQSIIYIYRIYICIILQVCICNNEIYIDKKCVYIYMHVCIYTYTCTNTCPIARHIFKKRIKLHAAYIEQYSYL